jgi:Aminomethyltransferase folate-binding domain
VQGHPLVVSYCFTTSAEEEGTKCGRRFANDRRIQVVEFGAVAVGNQSFYAALRNRKPTVGGVLLLPVDGQRKTGFGLFGTNDSVLGPWGTLAKNVLPVPGAGPNAIAVIEKALGGTPPELRFFNMTTVEIAGKQVRALRHGMVGQPGWELFAPWDDEPAVHEALLAAGEEYGMRQVGGRA